MRCFALILTLLLSNNTLVLADFEYEIDLCYKFVSCNAVDTCICRHNDTVVFSPMSYRGIGPVQYYAQTVDHLLLQTIGRETLPHNQYENPIETEIWYFAIDISNDSVEGPISQSDFKSDPRFNGKLNWKSAAHPLRYLFLTLLLIVMVLAMAGPVWLVRQRLKTTAG